jgi:Rrf2 family transcriptional regulator, nitric oxide-sensitive transcriptional repressor
MWTSISICPESEPKLISQTAEYALRAVAALAGNPDEPMVTQRLAEATKVPAGYLSKVLQSLGRAGLVNSTRGVGGGFVLARPASEITIYDIVQAVDPLQRIRTCPLGLASHGVRLCPLHKRLDDAMKQVEDAFRASNLAEVLAEPTESKPLCSFPVEKLASKKG